jgi:hypothetical protein
VLGVDVPRRVPHRAAAGGLILKYVSRGVVRETDFSLVADLPIEIGQALERKECQQVAYPLSVARAPDSPQRLPGCYFPWRSLLLEQAADVSCGLQKAHSTEPFQHRVLTTFEAGLAGMVVADVSHGIRMSVRVPRAIVLLAAAVWWRATRCPEVFHASVGARTWHCVRVKFLGDMGFNRI